MADGDRRSWKNAYKLMDYTFQDYLFRLVIPFSGLGISCLIVSLLFPDLLGPTRYVMYFMGFFFPIIGVFYPKIWADRRKREIEQNIHLFITHAGVLATAELDRIEILRLLADREEDYGPLAEEIGKVIGLIDTWNRSLEEACQYASQSTPSDILADFLDRMGRAAAAGEDIRDFLIDEQDVVISDYEAMYMDSLSRMDDFRDLFISMILATVFFVVFSIIAPFITGVPPLLLLGMALGIFIASEMGFILATLFTLPEDPIWGDMEIEADWESRMGRAQLFSIIAFAGLAIFSAAHLIFGFFRGIPLPLPVLMALPLTPFVVPGLMTWRKEGEIKKKDENYPGFIRTLATSASASDATTEEVLDSLREKDFGALTEDIRNLYKRLKMRAEEALAWDHFSADSGSYLIRRFNDMYLEGTGHGGDPKSMGGIVMENFKKINRIRNRREGFGGTITGVLYGISSAAITAFFIGFYFMKQMKDEIASMSQPSEISSIFKTELYDMAEIQFVLIGAIFANAILVAVYIRAVRGGHEGSSFAHATFLVWLGVGITFLIDKVASAFLPI